MDAGSLTLFTRVIAMGSSSLLQYVSESFPWSGDPTHAALQKVRALAAEERDAVARLTRLLQRKKLRMPVVGYPSHFTTINFCSLDYLLPKLVIEHEREIVELQSRIAGAEDEEIRKLAQSYLDMKRGHLQTLQELVRPSAGAA